MTDRLPKKIRPVMEYMRKPYLVTKETVAVGDEPPDYQRMMQLVWSKKQDNDASPVQSAMKKPYQHRDYQGMEQMGDTKFAHQYSFLKKFDGPPGVPPHQKGELEISKDKVFACHHTDCFCAYSSDTLRITCDHEILMLHYLSNGERGREENPLVGNRKSATIFPFTRGGQVWPTIQAGSANGKWTLDRNEVAFHVYMEGGGWYQNATYHRCPEEQCCECGQSPPSLSLESAVLTYGASQVISVVDGNNYKPTCKFRWSLSGDGKLSATEGVSVTYTAPTANPNCQTETVTMICEPSGASDSVSFTIVDPTKALQDHLTKETLVSLNPGTGLGCCGTYCCSHQVRYSCTGAILSDLYIQATHFSGSCGCTKTDGCSEDGESPYYHCAHGAGRTCIYHAYPSECTDPDSENGCCYVPA